MPNQCLSRLPMALAFVEAGTSGGGLELEPSIWLKIGVTGAQHSILEAEKVRVTGVALVTHWS